MAGAQGPGRHWRASSGGRLLGRVALVAVAVAWIQGAGAGGIAWGQSAAPSIGSSQDWSRLRTLLLERNQALQRQLESVRSCLQGASSLGALDRCRLNHPWPYGRTLRRNDGSGNIDGSADIDGSGNIDGRSVPWSDCPLW